MKIKTLLLLLIFYLLQIFTPTTYALEKGVQLPSERPIDRLKTYPTSFKWIKFQYRWDVANEQPVETWVNAANAAGYKVLLSVTHKPKDVPAGEEGYAMYGEFMKNLAAKFKDKVDAFEIWNEPNITEEWSDVGMGDINPSEYAKLLEYGAAGVKTGNPNAKVISAGLATNAPNETDFFYAYTSAADLSNVDFLGVHLNITSNIPALDENSTGFQRIKLFLSPNKPIWVSEFGWGRNVAGINRITQLQYIDQAFKLAETFQQVKVMFVWNFGFAKENPGFSEWDIEEDANTPAPDACPGLTSHECAVKNQNQFLLPPIVNLDIKPITDQENFIGKLTAIAAKFLTFLGFDVKDPKILPPRATTQDQTEIPEQVLSKDSDIFKKTSEDLGKDTGVGIYNKDIAEQAQTNKTTTCEFEKLYEGSVFPDNIHPITYSGGSGCQNP